MKISKIKRTLLWMVATMLSVAMIMPVQADQLENIKKSGVLKVAVPQDFPPFGSVGADLKPQGYDIDMAAYLAKELGVKLKLVPVTSANRIPYLQTRKVDLVISSLGKNPEREKAIDFSKPYAPFFLGVFGLADVEVAGIADLSGKTIAVTRGSVEDLELSKSLPDDAVMKRFEDNNTTISAFLSGQVDLIATGNLVIASIAERNPARLPVTKFLLKNSPCYIGVHKNEPELMAKINTLIAKAYEDGVLEGISQKWLKAAYPNELSML